VVTHSFWSTSWAPEPAGSSRNFWRPLVLATYALDWALGSGSPVVFHATNLFCHGLASALAFFALRRWLGQTWRRCSRLALGGAPDQERIGRVDAGRPDLLLSLGVFLTLAGVAARLERRLWGWPLELLGVVVAFGSKEQRGRAPGSSAAIEVCAHAGWPAPRRLPWRLLATHAGPQLVLALGYLTWDSGGCRCGSGGGDWTGLVIASGPCSKPTVGTA
jgi:hypothetical protein